MSLLNAEYHIIDGNDKISVVTTVDEHLANGWEISGSLCMTSVLLGNNIVTRYAQAMIKQIDNISGHDM